MALPLYTQSQRGKKIFKFYLNSKTGMKKLCESLWSSETRSWDLLRRNKLTTALSSNRQNGIETQTTNANNMYKTSMYVFLSHNILGRNL